MVDKIIRWQGQKDWDWFRHVWLVADYRADGFDRYMGFELAGDNAVRRG